MTASLMPVRWPDPTSPVNVDGPVSSIESGWRRLGGVRLHWRPPTGSRFWDERGVLRILLGALVNTVDESGRSLVDHLELVGIDVQVVESDFGCRIDMTGDHDALLRSVPLVIRALNRREIPDAAVAVAERRFRQERRIHRQRLAGAAEPHQWQHFLRAPSRLWRDHESTPDSVAALCDILRSDAPGSDASRLGGSRLGGSWLGATEAIVVGRPELATAWREAISPDSGTSGTPEPVPAPRHDERLVTVPWHRGGQSLVSYGAVTSIATLPEMFEQELVLELLAGWSGSHLTSLLRQELALTYSVQTTARVTRLADQNVLRWAIWLQTRATETERVRAHMDARLAMLRAHPPSEPDVIRSALRLLRRLRLWEDSVAGVMALHGTDIQNGYPRMMACRREFLRSAGVAQVRSGLARMADDGVYVVVGDALPGSGRP